MKLDYEGHPAFRFGIPSLPVAQRLLQNFDDCYEFLRQFASELKSSTREPARRECADSLHEIFAELRLASSDPLEVEFIDELLAECRRLLAEELTFFAARPLVSAVAGKRAGIGGKALALLRHRHYFGLLPASAVQEVLSVGARDISRFREAVCAGRLAREDLSVNSGSAISEIVRVLNREFRKDGTNDAVSVYMARRMSVTGVALELSTAKANWWSNHHAALERPPKTLYAHLDESIGYPKSIVYLSEVDDSNGPTSCYPQMYERLGLRPLQEIIGRVLGNVGGSPRSRLHAHYDRRYHQAMSSENFRRHFMRLPVALRFNSHFGWDVLPGSTAEELMVGCEVKMKGAAGTHIVFDGARLVHRGGLLRQGERLALQVVFSSTNGRRRNVLKSIRRRLAFKDSVR